LITWASRRTAGAAVGAGFEGVGAGVGFGGEASTGCRIVGRLTRDTWTEASGCSPLCTNRMPATKTTTQR
jgi:hypothetical protein